MILIHYANSVNRIFSATLEFLGLQNAPSTLSMAQGRRLVSHRWMQTNQYVGLEYDEQARMHPVSGCLHCSQRIHRRLSFWVLARATRYREEACPVPRTMAFSTIRESIRYAVCNYMLLNTDSICGRSTVEQFNPIHRATVDIGLFIVVCSSIISLSVQPICPRKQCVKFPGLANAARKLGRRGLRIHMVVAQRL